VAQIQIAPLAVSFNPPGDSLRIYCDMSFEQLRNFFSNVSFIKIPRSGVKMEFGSRLDRFQFADLSKNIVGERLDH
jgi:hypothetical protein